MTAYRHNSLRYKESLPHIFWRAVLSLSYLRWVKINKKDNVLFSPAQAFFVKNTGRRIHRLVGARFPHPASCNPTATPTQPAVKTTLDPTTIKI